MKLVYWIKAARLRTLPLAFSCILMGAAIAKICSFEFSIIKLILALFTTLFLQILSNFANDYGDGIKGSDQYRQTNDRMVQTGKISKKEMKKGIIIMSISGFFSGLLLIFFSFPSEDTYKILLFLVLGVLAIVAAIKYTVGRAAYGYHGLGDLFVFLFFGIVGVFGSFFLFTQEINILAVPGSLYIGSLSCAVLNLNNMRDIENDIKSNKQTFAALLGQKKSKIYHYFLIITAFISLIFLLISSGSKLYYLSILPFIICLINILSVYKNKNPQDLDGELKKVALSCFITCLMLYVTGIII
ncbi:MAG: 1,4-dihydroxy-2-naphthoate octaprenyltransferase [Bacteroidota bacterium]|nr:1,4-dihydroxy-2-naphthoate octaprenyltransferase [Bacteroidota bacterium]